MYDSRWSRATPWKNTHRLLNSDSVSIGPQLKNRSVQLHLVSDLVGRLQNKHVPTAFQTPFSFFEDFPREVRDKIYGYLIGDLEVHVASSEQSTQIHRRQALTRWRSRGSVGFLPRRSGKLPYQSFLSVSRAFFCEIRDIVHHNMAVEFELRWDFIKAFINGSLHLDMAVPRSEVSTNVSMLSGPSVFTGIRELHLNMCSSEDFNGRVYTSEARRLTLSMLQIIKQNMHCLKTLVLTVDERSRVCSCAMVFLPDIWFFKELLALTQLKLLKLLPGPSYTGRSTTKRSFRQCISAINGILRVHYAVSPDRRRLCIDGQSGTKLQIKLARMMLQCMGGRSDFRDAVTALTLKVIMLQSVAQ